MTKTLAAPEWHTVFLKMLPGVRRYARLAFRHMGAEAREENIQNVLCMVCGALARLAEQGKLCVAYPTPLARHAIAQTWEGRVFGCPMNCEDVSSPLRMRQERVTLERLDCSESDGDYWQEGAMYDTGPGPAESAGIRLDFRASMKGLPRRERRVAATLGAGHGSTETARKFSLSVGRISQIRRDLRESWQQFISS
jgi:hypothetical protein